MQSLILLPVIGMALLTFVVAFCMLLLRIKAVKNKQLPRSYFLLNRGGEPPQDLVKASNHFNNLFEFPVLFYVVVLSLLVLEVVDSIYIVLAWAYLLLRVVHAYIHIAYNNVSHRRNVFLLSLVVLYAIWIRLLLQLLAQ